MADFGGILDPIANVAMGQTAGQWVFMGIYLIVSTLVSGIILVILLKILSSVWGEEYDMGHAFLVALVVNIINMTVLGFIYAYIAFIPPIVLYILVWIVLVKLFFRDMAWPKATIVGIAGFALSMVIAPILTGYIMAFIPFFGA